MNGYSNILVFGEMDNGKLCPLTTQLMGIGKRLAGELKQELHLLIIGGEKLHANKDGFCYGADQVCVVKDPLFENYVTDSYLQAMEQIVREQKPEIVLFGHNDKGLDLAARLAFRVKTGVTLDCVDLAIDTASGLLKHVKPVFGGKAHGEYYADEGRPQIVSIRDGAFEPADYEDSKSGEVLSVKVSIDPSQIRTRFVEKQKDESLDLALKLASAKVVVSGGRGLKEKEGFAVLEDTAALLGGAIAGSRPAIDNGWIPNALQVGLTGRKVNPQVYFAVGISGAMQHMAGCLKSKTIVAVNKDEEAPIFRMSNYGVVGEWREVLEAFNEEVRLIKDKLS